MAKLTKSQREALREVLRHAERALAFVGQPDIAICRKREIGTDKNGRPYPPSHHGWQSAMTPGAELIGPIEKRAGSDLVGLQDAVDKLGAFLAHH